MIALGQWPQSSGRACAAPDYGRALADFVFRPCGGIMSDLMGRRYGMRGRIWVVFIGLALGGARLAAALSMAVHAARPAPVWQAWPGVHACHACRLLVNFGQRSGRSLLGVACICMAALLSCQCSAGLEGAFASSGERVGLSGAAGARSLRCRLRAAGVCVSLMGVVHNSLGLTMLFLVLSALFLEVRSLQRSSALCRGITRLGTGKPMHRDTRDQGALVRRLLGVWPLGVRRTNAVALVACLRGCCAPTHVCCASYWGALLIWCSTCDSADMFLQPCPLAGPKYELSAVAPPH